MKSAFAIPFAISLCGVSLAGQSIQHPSFGVACVEGPVKQKDALFLTFLMRARSRWKRHIWRMAAW